MCLQCKMSYSNAITNICCLLRFLCCAHRSSTWALRILLWLWLSFLPLRCWNVVSSCVVWRWDLFPFLKIDQLSSGRCVKRETALLECFCFTFLPFKKAADNVGDVLKEVTQMFLVMGIFSGLFTSLISGLGQSISGWGKKWTLNVHFLGGGAHSLWHSPCCATIAWHFLLWASLQRDAKNSSWMQSWGRGVVVVVKPHPISFDLSEEKTSRTEWADPRWLGSDNDQILFLGSLQNGGVPETSSGCSFCFLPKCWGSAD